jgi:hypothetical protein
MQINTINIAKSKLKCKKVASEDYVVAIHSKLLGVFDGTSSVCKKKICGKTAGEFAASVAANAAINFRFSLDDRTKKLNGDQLISYMSHELSNKYLKLSLSRPFPSTTCAVVFIFQDFFHFLIIGDTGVRINNSIIYKNELRIDEIWGALRKYIFQFSIEKMHGSNYLQNYSVESGNKLFERCELLSRKIIFEGLGIASKSLIEYVEMKLLCDIQGSMDWRESYDLIIKMMHQGISKIQYKYANLSGSKYGYAILNGDPVMTEGVTAFHLPCESVERIEIFSDGYLAPPSKKKEGGSTIEDWELSYREIEKDDPFHIGKWPHIKCAIKDEFFDDRSLVIAEFN